MWKKKKEMKFFFYIVKIIEVFVNYTIHIWPRMLQRFMLIYKLKTYSWRCKKIFMLSIIAKYHVKCVNSKNVFESILLIS